MTDRSYRFASTASSVAWARRVGKLVPVSQARTGDIVVHLYTSTTGHTGMVVVGTAAPGRVSTCEGNTSGGNDRDGGSVQERDRPLSFWQYCIRLDWTPEERAAAVALARSQIGETEHPFGSNCQKFGAWYQFNCVAWCAEFMSWVVALFVAQPEPPEPTPEPPVEDDVTPAICFDSKGRRWVFGRGDDGKTVSAKVDDGDWFSIGGSATSGLSAAAANGEVTVVCRGGDNAAYARSHDDNDPPGTWPADWASLGGVLT